MKVLLLLSTSQLLAQNTIDGRISKAEEKCALFLDKALVCVPPEVKVSKYQHRLSKVMKDAKWHKSRGKCDTKRRRRNDGNDTIETNLDELEATLDQEYDETLANMAAESERV